MYVDCLHRIECVVSMVIVCSGLMEEIELLQAIYITELSIEEDEDGRPQRLLLDLHPATGEHTDQQLVHMILDILLSKQVRWGEIYHQKSLTP